MAWKTFSNIFLFPSETYNILQNVAYRIMDYPQLQIPCTNQYQRTVLGN